MAGLEVVVRPVLLPNIRPAAARVLPPEDDPEKGIATLGGSGGRLIDLPYSFHSSMQKTPHHYEFSRTFDVDRISQKNDDGTVNKNNFVDVERVKKIQMSSLAGNRDNESYNYATPPVADNVKTIQTDQVRTAQ